jgi:hypothetical protein
VPAGTRAVLRSPTLYCSTITPCMIATTWKSIAKAWQDRSLELDAILPNLGAVK